MKQLPQTLTRKKFIYEQIQRSDKAALYSQKEGDKILAYEVFKVRKLNSYVLAGITFEESEAFPHDEAFGLWAWSIPVFSDLERVLKRAEGIYTKLNTNLDEANND